VTAVCRIRRSLTTEHGYSVAELAVVTLIGSVALALLASFVVHVLQSGAFTEGQSATLNDARNALQKIEKEVRGADSINWCAPAGSCLEVGAQTPIASFRTVRYTHTGTELRREVYDPGTSTWGPALTLIERVANSASEPVFACDTQSTLLRVNVDLRIQPTPQSDPTYNLATSLRPRNFPSVASCP
jgi:hypothetical protein